VTAEVPFTGGDTPEKPPRRIRYRGTHPRRYAEKYKELQPEQHAETVAKVIASGKTPAGMHRPVLLEEVIAALAPEPGQTVVDCTLGYGGHARALLDAVQPGGRLIGLDVDPVEFPKTCERLRALGHPETALSLHRSNYAGLARLLQGIAPEGVHAVFADLGLSSMHSDNPDRGFTFKADGPFDLRMNPERGMSAAQWLAKADEATLRKALATNADEPLAEPLAREIVQARARGVPLATTLQVAAAVRRVVLPAAGRRAAPDPDDVVRRFFQAVRIEVNDEFAALETFLRTLPGCLLPGGRVAILTFHSGEDRRVKAAFQAGVAHGTYITTNRRVITPTLPETRANPRARSAKLRWAVRAS
jgi:16S rRNA (cytosine1402-N4)-methyltransferase